MTAQDVSVMKMKKEKKSKKEKTAEVDSVVEKRSAEEQTESVPVSKKAKKEKKAKNKETVVVEEVAEVVPVEKVVAEKKSKKSKKAEAVVEEEKDTDSKTQVEQKEEVAEEKKEEAVAEKKEEVSGEEEVFKCLISGLPWSCTEESVRKDFEECGEINDFGMPKDRETGEYRGLAFIGYTTKEALDKALAYNETDYNGRTIYAKVADSKKGKGKDGKGKGKGKGVKPEGCKSVVLKFMSPDTEEDGIWTFFESCGTVERVKLLTDENGYSKCLAFVDFEATESTDAAVKLSNTELDGKAVVVDFNAPREKGEKGKKGKGKGKGKGKKW